MDENLADFLARGLAESPDATLALVADCFGDGQVQHARDVLELAGSPAVGPDEPGKPHCGWCGRTGPGLADESHGGPPVHRCPDEEWDKCNAEHDRKIEHARRRELDEYLASRRQLFAEQPYYERLKQGTGFGYKEPGWMSQTAEAVQVLDEAQAAREALRSWLLVQFASEPDAGLVAALSASADDLARMINVPQAAGMDTGPDLYNLGHGNIQPDAAGRPGLTRVVQDGGLAVPPQAAAYTGWNSTLRNPANRAHLVNSGTAAAGRKPVPADGRHRHRRGQRLFAG